MSLKAMRRRAVPKISAKSLVPPGSPLNKLRSLSTRSESTLPQTLIPLDFISFSSNVYKKPGEGAPRLTPKVCELVTKRSPFLRARTNVRNPTPLIHLLHNLRTPRGWGISQVGQPILAVVPRPFAGHGTRATDYRSYWSPVPLRGNPQSARITGVNGCSRRETYPPRLVSKVLRADIG